MKKTDLKLLAIVTGGVLLAGVMMNQLDALEVASDGFNK